MPSQQAVDQISGTSTFKQYFGLQKLVVKGQCHGIEELSLLKITGVGVN